MVLVPSSIHGFSQFVQFVHLFSGETGDGVNLEIPWGLYDPTIDLRQ